MRLLAALVLAVLLSPVPAVSATAQAAQVLKVGPGEEYRTPCAAFAVAQDGDTVTIDAAGSKDYRGDVCAITADRLRIKGVHGRPHVRAAGSSAEGKAIWVVKGDDNRISNVELSGARVPDRNGAAIRQEGTDLTLKRVWFHHNEMGLLAGDNAESDIVIHRSRFSDNGFGDGLSHNIYVNHVASLAMSFSWSSRSHVGHLVKSRAATTLLYYNRFSTDGGDGSYEVDLPNGGLGVLVGNSVTQGRETDNASLIAYGEEGDVQPGGLYVVGNTLVDDYGTGGRAVYIGFDVENPVVLRNNVVVDFTTVADPGAVLAGNCVTTTPRFRDRRGLDYWLRSSSPCLAVAAVRPGKVEGWRLRPLAHYRHPARAAHRDDRGRIVGAFGTPRPG